MIDINGLSKNYNGLMALNNLHLKIEDGEIYGMLGANGAGKTTTINLMLGLIKPDGGFAKINGFDCYSKRNELTKQIGYIPENVQLYTYLTGIENLKYFSRLAGLKYSNDELKNILINCGLSGEFINKRLEVYSKGMIQKVGIAIALAKKSKVLILDEPSSGLDPKAANELSDILINLSKNGTTIFMASHDIFRTRETCNRIGILKQGALLNEILASDVSSNELEKIYINYMHG
jgi:ABC-2 type transport system ATP-binding protein